MTSRFAINGVASATRTQLETGPCPRGPMLEARALFGQAGTAWDVAFCLVAADGQARPDRRRVAAMAMMWEGALAVLVARDAPRDARALYCAATVLRNAVDPAKHRPALRTAVPRGLKQAQAARQAP